MVASPLEVGRRWFSTLFSGVDLCHHPVSADRCTYALIAG
jgi:hypothetical protein